MELKSVLLEKFMELLTELAAEDWLSALTGRKKRGEESIHLEPSGARPPAGTM